MEFENIPEDEIKKLNEVLQEEARKYTTAEYNVLLEQWDKSTLEEKFKIYLKGASQFMCCIFEWHKDNSDSRCLLIMQSLFQSLCSQINEHFYPAVIEQRYNTRIAVDVEELKRLMELKNDQS